MQADNKYWHAAIATLNAKQHVDNLYQALKDDNSVAASIYVKLALQELAEVGQHLTDVVRRFPRKPIL